MSPRRPDRGGYAGRGGKRRRSNVITEEDLKKAGIVFESPPAKDGTLAVPLEPDRPRTMTREEQIYASRLEVLRLAGEIRAWSFESRQFRLANRSWYTPDFEVVHPQLVELVEVKPGRARPPKGRPNARLALWEEDARVKWKQAAALYPHFKWTAASLEGRPRQWKLEDASRQAVLVVPLVPEPLARDLALVGRLDALLEALRDPSPKLAPIRGELDRITRELLGRGS